MIHAENALSARSKIRGVAYALTIHIGGNDFVAGVVRELADRILLVVEYF